MSNAPVFRRDQYSDLYGSSMLPVLEELFKSDMAQHPSRRSELFKIVSTERDIWQSSEIHDLDLFNQISEGSEYDFVRGKAGASKTLTMQKYGLGFSISEEAVEDGKFDMIADHVQKLARSARETQEIQAMNVFNNGFGSETSADGVSVFNASHTLPSGSTFRNKLTTDADLSVTSLEQALTDFETQFVGDSGIIYRKEAKILLVNPANKRLAKELIGSDLKADTSDNNMNSFKEEGLRVISSPHITDTDSWYLLADPSETGMRIVQRTPIQTKVGGDAAGFNTDSILYKSRYREDLGVTHAYGIFGTTGAT